MSARLLLLAGVAVVLAACGKQGELQRPGPLFGQARPVFPSDVGRGSPDETSPAENEQEDREAGLPSPDEETRPRDPSIPAQRAAPVNIPPTR